MKNILQINASIFADGGQSTRLASQFVDNWRQQHMDTQVTLRDFSQQPIPHLDSNTFQAFVTPQQERTAEQQAAVTASDELIAELKQADVIVLGLPMYNFGVPSQLKAWFDHVARAGITFRYTENGPAGMLENKPVYVLAARGGLYQGTPRDTQTGYVTDFFNFLGLTDVHFIYAEGLAMGDASRDAALDAAQQKIRQLAA